VCLNIDITKPLRGSLFIPIPKQPKPLEVPISYEGLHEVCALCGSHAHALESCLETPKGPIEVIVEKFGATKLQNESDQVHVPTPSSSTPPEKWVTVSPKKRGRSFPSGKRKNVTQIVVAPVSPSVQVISHPAPVNVNASSFPPVSMGLAPLISSNDGTAAILPHPHPQVGIVVDVTSASLPVEPLVGDSGLSFRPQGLEPASSEANRSLSSGSNVNASTPTSPLEGSELEDDDVTMFLNLEAEEEVQPSTESSKKRRLEEGDASSPLQSNI